MSNINKVYTPIAVKELAPPIYRPYIVPEVAPKLSPPVENMYLTKEETTEGTIWWLNIVSVDEQEYKYRLYVYWD